MRGWPSATVLLPNLSFLAADVRHCATSLLRRRLAALAFSRIRSLTGGLVLVAGFAILAHSWPGLRLVDFQRKHARRLARWLHGRSRVGIVLPRGMHPQLLIWRCDQD